MIPDEFQIKQPAAPLMDSNSPYEIFGLILTQGFWNFLANETNSYASPSGVFVLLELLMLLRVFV